MSAVRTPWHVYFAIFLKENAPPDVELRFEVVLTTEPQRGDILLLRRGRGGHRDGEAKTFRNLWPLLGMETLVEYKSLAWPLRRGDFARLEGYGSQYFAARIEETSLALADLSLLLIVPTWTPTLDEELDRMGWTATPLSPGYAKILGSGYTMILAVIEEVTRAEQDHLLGLFSRKKKGWTSDQIAWFWQHHAGNLEGVNVQDVDGYKQIIRDMLASLPIEQRLEGIPPEQRLQGIPPEQRLQGIPPEQRVIGLTVAQQLLTLPDEVLRALSDEYLQTLPPEVVATIRARLSRPGAH